MVAEILQHHHYLVQRYAPTLYSFLNALGLATTQINKGISPCDWERTMSSNLGEKAHEVACSLLKNRAVPGKVAHLCDAVYLIS